MTTPVLYSSRRCPYCMRAHMALKNAGIKVELREVDLHDMPQQALAVSAKATVPLLVFSDGSFIDESWDIVKWAVAQNDPDNWCGENNEYMLEAEMLVETNDFSFKADLDHYQYADRHPEQTAEEYREACEEFVEELEDMLADSDFLLGNRMSLADIGIFPFIRQFSLIDKDWFEQSPYHHIKHWLNTILNTPLFAQVYTKHRLWKKGDQAIYI